MPAPTPAIALASAPAIDEEEHLAPHARRYMLVVTDATDDDVHHALSNLPPQAGYHLVASEQPVDGH